MNTWDRISYLLSTHQHVHENIRFADQKALAIFVLNTSLIAGLYGIGILKPAKSGLAVFCIITFILLAIAVLLSMAVMWPRGFEIRIKRGKGLADPLRIALWENDEKGYIGRVSAIDDNELIEEISYLVLDRSKINDAKYYYLRWGIGISIVAWFTSLLVILSTTFF